jgi:cell division protein FtsW (lipid II flippase)
LFWLLFVLAISLIIFGHHDPRQVLKMRLAGCFLLVILIVLRLVLSFGKLNSINKDQKDK